MPATARITSVPTTTNNDAQKLYDNAPLGVGRMEQDCTKLRALYDEGYALADKLTINQN